MFSLVLFFKSCNDNGSETFKSLFPVLCRTPCGSEWLHSQLLNANATVVDFLISPSLNMTLSQARVLYDRDKDRKESNSNKVKELSFNAH